MLCLNRQLGQTVVITLPDGREIRVTVVAYRRDGLRLGFDAPSDIVVNRLEVHERLKREKGGQGDGPSGEQA